MLLTVLDFAQLSDLDLADDGRYLWFLNINLVDAHIVVKR